MLNDVTQITQEAPPAPETGTELPSATKGLKKEVSPLPEVPMVEDELEGESDTIVDRMEKESGPESIDSQGNLPSAILAESQGDTAILPKNFAEDLFLTALPSNSALKDHASALNENEVHDFVNAIVSAAGSHNRKLGDLLTIAKPYILRDREFYNKQGMRNATGKTWTDRKKELAEMYGVGLRTFERGFSEIKGKLVGYKFQIPGLELEVKVLKDLLPQVELIANLARSSGREKQALKVAEPLDVGSPLELWQLIDEKLTDAVEDVFHVSAPQEFAGRLRQFARAVADAFFPGTLVEISAAPEGSEREGESL